MTSSIVENDPFDGVSLTDALARYGIHHEPGNRQNGQRYLWSGEQCLGLANVDEGWAIARLLYSTYDRGFEDGFTDGSNEATGEAS